MSEENEEIKIIGVDKDAIEMSSGKQNLWIIGFKLSAKPDQDWDRRFYEVEQREKNSMKRKVQIVGDCIKVEVSDRDDLQKVLDVVKAEVSETNILRDGDYQKKLEMRRELLALQRKQEDVTLKFRQAADKLQF